MNVVADSQHDVTHDAGRMVVAGRYHLLALVAPGGRGRIWRAHDDLLDREVAVKELVTPAEMPVGSRREAQLRTVREARAAAQLNHPGVVQIYDVVQTTSRSWIVMEYVGSRSLHDVMAQQGPLTHQEAARVGLAVLGALRAAHAADVLHLDVKPHNVLIASDGRVVLTDFGLATLGVTGRTGNAEPLLGSPRYVAPELVRDGVGDARTDLWSLGATLYAAVEGRPPFQRPTIAESLAAVLVDTPDPPRHPGPLHPVIAGLLATDPARRSTAVEAQAALQALMHRAVGVVAVPAPRRLTRDAVRFRPGVANPASVAPRLPQPEVAPESSMVPRSRPADRTRIAVAGAAMIAVAVAVAGGVMAWGSGGEPSAPETNVAAASPDPTSTGAATEVAPCSGVVPQPLAATATAAPYSLPDGWLWHVDPAGFALPVPTGWTRATAAGVVCFGDPEGARTFTAQAVPARAADPLRYWQAAEKRVLDAETLLGYRKVSMDVLLVSGGGADWEYSWQPAAGPRLHTRRVLLSAADGRPYELAWTTRSQDWDINLADQQTVLTGFRDPSGIASPWGVPRP